MLMVLVTVNKSLSCFLKSINIYITLYHIIIMICMLFERLQNCENVKYVISHSDVVNNKNIYLKSNIQCI